MAKITKTYSIDEKLYGAFERVTNENNVNKSSFIEKCINKYLEDNNWYGVNKIFVLKTDPNYCVSILRQDDTYYFLNDGSKIPIILFMQMYKEVDQINPTTFFNPDASDTNMIDPVNPNEFFDSSLKGADNVVQDFLKKTGFEGSERINS